LLGQYRAGCEVRTISLDSERPVIVREHEYRLGGDGGFEPVEGELLV
jgi:hypothetical protein